MRHTTCPTVHLSSMSVLLVVYPSDHSAAWVLGVKQVPCLGSSRQGAQLVFARDQAGERGDEKLNSRVYSCPEMGNAEGGRRVCQLSSEDDHPPIR